METDAEVWITGFVETDAEVWISAVVTTGGRVHGYTVIAFTLFRVLTDYWTASIIVSICVAHLGFEDITNGCIT